MGYFTDNELERMGALRTKKVEELTPEEKALAIRKMNEYFIQVICEDVVAESFPSDGVVSRALARIRARNRKQ
jgi:hypothetical protein